MSCDIDFIRVKKIGSFSLLYHMSVNNHELDSEGA